VTPTLSLRIASVLTFVHAVLHTVGGVFGTPAAGVQQATVALMKANQFPVMGLTRSYWDFQLGLGLGVTVMLLVESVVFWQLGSLARTDAAQVRPIVVTFLIGYLALAVNSYAFFFLPPAIAEIVIVGFLGYSCFRV
jgi:hypothetical protein